MQTPDPQTLGAMSDFSRLLGDRVAALEWLSGGGNSRVCKLACERRGTLAGKLYFPHRLRPKNHLQVEFSALEFLWRNGVRRVPQPVAADPERGCAVYEFIEGVKVPTASVSEADMDEAVEFLAALRDLVSRPGAGGLPVAAEAFFAVPGIVGNLEHRLARLSAVPRTGGLRPALHEFLESELRPCLRDMVASARTQLDGAGIGFEAEVDGASRTLSPSDFGFHNALRRPGGGLVFLDFEYFGWDDPAKMISDFVLHPGMDLPEVLRQRFWAGIRGRFRENKNLAKRLESVYPLFGLKWCLILLNEFIPEHLQRRGFARGGVMDVDAAQAQQLSKAKRMLARIRTEHEFFPYRDCLG